MKKPKDKYKCDHLELISKREFFDLVNHLIKQKSNKGIKTDKTI